MLCGPDWLREDLLCLPSERRVSGGKGEDVNPQKGSTKYPAKTPVRHKNISNQGHAQVGARDRP